MVDEPAAGRVRPRRPARRRGDDDARPVSIARVRVYTAAGCHLCEAALEAVDTVRLEMPFELEVIDIGGDAELEARHREHLPVVEIDGEQAFTWFVDPGALRERILAAR